MSDAADRIDRLMHELEHVRDAEARATALALVQSILDVHAEAFERVLELCDAQRLAADPLVGSLLLLYGLHPEPVESRVERALEKVRPYIQSHGGRVALLGVDDDGVVHLSMDGTCHDCPSSEQTMKLAIEQAIFEAAPEVVRVARSM
jgi:Fe-S cluster biogenesis protein NfuA